MAKAFQDQVVVITGGGRGIGRATAIEFAAEGATLLLAGRRMDALQTAAARVDARRRARRRDRPLRRGEGRRPEGARRQGDRASYGRLDVLVNNAGVVAGGRLDEIGADDVERMTSVNIWAPIRLAQLALPHMRAGEERHDRQHLVGGGPDGAAVLRDVLRQQVRDARLQRVAAARGVAGRHPRDGGVPGADGDGPDGERRVRPA